MLKTRLWPCAESVVSECEKREIGPQEAHMKLHQDISPYISLHYFKEDIIMPKANIISSTIEKKDNTMPSAAHRDGTARPISAI